MNSYRKYGYVFFIAGLFLVSGCKKMSDLRENPNNGTKASPDVLLTGILQQMYFFPWGDVQQSSQFHCLITSYYGDQSYNFGAAKFYYPALRNINQMVKEARQTGGQNMQPYYALSYFLKAFFYIQMTSQVGDIPMDDAMKAEEGVFEPAYNTQKEIYVQCLKWLEMANDSLAAINSQPLNTLKGDVFFNGNLVKWQKLVNTFRLRVLISLSKQVNDPDIHAKEQFEQIFEHPERFPVILENADNMQITYREDNSTNYYPGFSENPEGAARKLPLAATIINLLVEYRDPRLFIIGLPEPIAASNGDPDYAIKFRSYRGASTGSLLSVLYDSLSAGHFSIPNYNYWFSAKKGVPTILLGAAETNFTIAEAINKGWIGNGNASLAAKYYKEGLTAALQFFMINADSIANYLTYPEVIYKGNNEAGLKQILEQKYLSFFENSGWEAFYNQRRTGIPAFNIGPSNKNGARIPRRWYYPQSEYLNNYTHLKAALLRQYAGADDLNSNMWLLQ
jgi:hypothetical protein